MSWRLDAAASTSPERVAVEAMGYGAPSSPRIGGPAPFSFTLTAQSTGLARLGFVYGRAWEAAVAETEVLYVCVIEPAPDTCAEPAAP